MEIQRNMKSEAILITILLFFCAKPVNAQMDFTSSPPMHSMDSIHSPLNHIQRNDDWHTNPMNPANPMNQLNQIRRNDDWITGPMKQMHRNDDWLMDQMIPAKKMQSESLDSGPDASLESDYITKSELLEARKNTLNINFGNYGLFGLEFTRDFLEKFAISTGANIGTFTSPLKQIFTFPVSLRYNFLTKQHHKPYFALGLMPILYSNKEILSAYFDLHMTDSEELLIERVEYDFYAFPFARLGYEYEFTSGAIIGLGLNGFASRTLQLLPGINAGISF